MSLKLDLDHKIEEVELLICELQQLDNKGGNVKLIGVLKSTVVMMLYNVIESMISSVLHEVHDHVSVVEYNKLKGKLKELFVGYHIVTNTKENARKIDSIVSDDLRFPSFGDYSDKMKLFSGNLDARKIDNILNKYGIGRIVGESKEKLLFVKNQRNKLAHGEISYIEACRDKTLNEIIEYKVSVNDVLNEVIRSAERYIDRRLFLENTT